MLDFNDENIYFLLVDACENYGVFPSSSLESEDYFQSLLRGYNGVHEQEAINNWLIRILEKEFLSLQAPPKWIQNPEWPIKNGKPMIFVGQWDISASDIEDVFHDDTSIYVFIGPQVSPEVVLQQY